MDLIYMKTAPIVDYITNRTLNGAYRFTTYETNRKVGNSSYYHLMS